MPLAKRFKLQLWKGYSWLTTWLIPSHLEAALWPCFLPQLPSQPSGTSSLQSASFARMSSRLINSINILNVPWDGRGRGGVWLQSLLLRITRYNISRTTKNETAAGTVFDGKQKNRPNGDLQMLPHAPDTRILLARGLKISTGMLLKWSMRWAWSKEAGTAFYPCHPLAVWSCTTCLSCVAAATSVK